MDEFGDDCKQLKTFLAFYNAKYWDMSKLSVHLRPGPLLEKTEREDPRRAIKNLRTEVNRIVSQSFNGKSDKSAQVEAAMKEEGIISVAELQQRFRKEYKAIIKRGQVEGLVEYYMAREIVDSGSIYEGRQGAPRGHDGRI